MPGRCSRASRTTSCCVARGGRLPRARASRVAARAARLAADRRRRARLGARRDLLHGGPVDATRPADPVARRRRLPALPAARARRHARAAARPRPRRPAGAAGRRRRPPRSASPPLSAAIVFETVLEQRRGRRRSPSRPASPTRSPTSCCSAVVVGALASTGWRLDRTWVLLAAGVSTFWLADSLYLVRTAAGRLRVRRLVRRRLVGRPGADRRRRVAARRRAAPAAPPTSACA